MKRNKMIKNYPPGLYSIFLIAMSTSILIINGCATDRPVELKNDLSDMNLKGDIKSIKEYSFEAVEIAGELRNGRRKTESTSSFDYFDKVILFNNDGNIMEEERYRSDDKLVGKQDYKYNAEGKKVEVNRYNMDGVLNLKVVYKYDNKGKMTEESKYNANGSLFLTTSNKFDTDQNMIEESAMTSTGGLFSRSTYDYDDNKNIIEANFYDFNGELERKKTYIYNDRGDVVEENNHLPDGSPAGKRTYTYEYDSLDNWTRKIIILNERPAYIIQREIEYYDL